MSGAGRAWGWEQKTPEQRADEMVVARVVRDAGEHALDAARRDYEKSIQAVAAKPAPLPQNDEDRVIAHQSGLPEIEANCIEWAVNAQAIQALATDKGTFQRGGLLVRVTRDLTPGKDPIRRPPNAPRIVAYNAAVLSETLTKVAVWVERKGKGRANCHPPGSAVGAILTRGEWAGVRGLENVVETPVMRPDGTVLLAPGYDPLSMLLLHPTVDVLAVPENPTKEQARAAADRLLDLVSDFPFDGEASKSGWLAALLSPFALDTFTGPVPMFVVDANAPASGKTLLADLIAAIARGRDFARTGACQDATETVKQLVSLALSGDRMVLFDNISGTFGNSALDRALTGTTIRERILGANQLCDLPLRPCWYATANNIQLAGDVFRRICYIRLKSPDEHPEQRTGFKYPDLLAHARTHRAEYVRDCLVVLRAWFAAGRPNPGVARWGSFEGWSQTVPAALVWLGLADPTSTRAELTQGGEVAAVKALVTGLRRLKWPANGLTARGILDQIGSAPAPGQDDEHEDLRGALDDLLPAAKDGRHSAHALGLVLGAKRARVVDGWSLDRLPSRSGTARWVMRGPPDTNARQPGDDDPDDSGERMFL